VRSIRVLVTGCSAPGIRGTLYALKNNSSRVRVNIVGTDLNPDGVGRFLTDRFCEIAAPESPFYVDSLVEIARAEKVDVILPQTTREVAVLSRHQNVFAALGIPVVVSGEQSVEIGNNKHRLLQLFQEMHLPHPDFVLAASESELLAAAQRLGYPDRAVVVKPPVSNGMRGFRIVKEEPWGQVRFFAEKPSGEVVGLEDLIAILRRGPSWPPLLVTEFLPGAEYSVDAFIGQHVKAAVPRLRRAIRSGISFDNKVEFRKDLEQPTLAAASQIGLRFAFGFQFKLDSAGTPKILECNPRVQGTMVASLFAGANLIWWSILEVLGQPLESLPPLSDRVRFVRYWGGVGISENEAHEI
jgi:carbamoyl-phosphate synthase large subunit